MRLRSIKTKQFSALNYGTCSDDEVSLSQSTSKKSERMVSLLQQRKGEQSGLKTSRQPATCMICKRSFTSKKMLKDHNAKHHFFRHCPNCSATFQQTRKFILHLQSHLHNSPYECKICLTRFQKKKILLNHKKKEHNYVNKLTCPICSEVFINFFSFTRHCLIHIGKPCPCYKCGAVFSNGYDKDVHMRNHVDPCTMCNAPFQLSEDFKYHLFFEHQLQEGNSGFMGSDISKRRKNTGTVKLKLEEDSDSDSMNDYCSSDNDSIPDIDNNCRKKAVEPVYNIKHKNKFICFICYASYPSPELLKSHMKPHNWYPCNSCPRFFAKYKTLKEHKQDCANPRIFADNKTFKKLKQDCANGPSFIRKNCDAEAECKNCGAKLECQNCKKNRSNPTGGISEGRISAFPKQKMPFPKVPSYPITKYCSPHNRGMLNDFIKYIIKADKPVDVFCISHIDSHIANLEKILKDNELRMLFPEEWIPGIKFLYSEFQDLCQNLNN